MAKTVAADETWTDILEQVKNHEEVVITQDGEPVARVVPVDVPRVRMTLDELRRSIHIVGDIMEPEDYLHPS